MTRPRLRLRMPGAGGGPSSGGALPVRTEAVAAAVIVVVGIGVATQSPVATSVAAFTMVWILMGQSWNIVSGMAGPLALGQAAFFGTADLLSLLLHTQYGLNTYLAIAAAILVCAALAALVGAATLRLPAFFFAIASLMVPLILQAIAEYRGYYQVLRPSYEQNTPSQFWWSGPFAYVVIGAVLVAAVAALTAFMARRRIGRFFVAIRENQRAAEASGVPTTRYKLYAFVIAAVVAGLAGCLYAQLTFVFDPTDAFDPSISVLALVVALVGGAGTVLGPVIGGLIVIPAQQLTHTYLHQAPGLDQIGYAVLLLLVALWFPRGVYPTVVTALRRRRAQRQARDPGAAAPAATIGTWGTSAKQGTTASASDQQETVG
jgi:branched-chain amino acid transport system permease protein